MGYKNRLVVYRVKLMRMSLKTYYSMLNCPYGHIVLADFLCVYLGKHPSIKEFIWYTAIQGPPDCLKIDGLGNGIDSNFLVTVSVGLSVGFCF